MLKTTYVLVLLYSPVSIYFAGTSVEEKPDAAACYQEMTARIGEELGGLGNIGWEKEMMGPMPKVVATYCAPGAVAK